PIQYQKLWGIVIMLKDVPSLESILGGGHAVIPLAQPAFEKPAEERVIVGHQNRIDPAGRDLLLGGFFGHSRNGAQRCSSIRTSAGAVCLEEFHVLAVKTNLLVIAGLAMGAEVILHLVP